MSAFTAFLKEGRHLFSICPHCGVIHRLTDLQLSARGQYVPDWLDKLEKKHGKIERTRAGLQARAMGLQLAAKERAEREVLPRLLRKAVPRFSELGIDPRDVRTVLHPTDFVVFRGMNSRDGVQEVSLLKFGVPDLVSLSIKSAIAEGSTGWRTVRVGDNGAITQEK